MNIKLIDISKTYGKTKVFSGFSAEFISGGIYSVMGESGLGKTTLLRLIAGLEKYDSGDIIIPDKTRFSFVFQENRLCEHLSAVENVRLVNVSLKREDIVREFIGLQFSEDDLKKPVSSFSGGMKRRVAVLRAIMAESDVVLMDEPFTGLDEHTKNATIDCILKNLNRRTLIVVTHSISDAECLNSKIISL